MRASLSSAGGANAGRVEQRRVLGLHGEPILAAKRLREPALFGAIGPRDPAGRFEQPHALLAWHVREDGSIPHDGLED